MRLRSVVRDVVLAVSLAGLGFSAGWWVRSAGTPVLARRSGSSSSTSSRGGDGGAGLGFELSGIGPDTSLTVYNAENRTLYVYRGIGQGSSHINCAYSFRVTQPGAPIERGNCPVGTLTPER